MSARRSGKRGREFREDADQGLHLKSSFDFNRVQRAAPGQRRPIDRIGLCGTETDVLAPGVGRILCVRYWHMAS